MGTTSMTIIVGWCKDTELAARFGQFFANNITPEYISHSELQGPRATDVGSWAADLEGVLTREIEDRIRNTRDASSDEEESRKLVVAAWDFQLIVGLGLVSFFPRAPKPYGVVEDIVVSKEHRGRRIGAKLLDWIIREAENQNYDRLFLESGISNDRAHKFFEDHGFTPCSIVMLKNLRANRSRGLNKP
jgi:ribosomal protein S18 acetylase RimI-like enzyme